MKINYEFHYANLRSNDSDLRRDDKMIFNNYILNNNFHLKNL
jgi:hypothetical protein